MGHRKQIAMTRCNFQESTAPASKYLHKLEILCDVIRAIFHTVTSTPTARSACVSVFLCPIPVTVTSVLCPSLVHAFGKCRVSVCPSVRLPICPCVSPSFCQSYAGHCYRHCYCCPSAGLPIFPCVSPQSNACFGNACFRHNKSNHCHCTSLPRTAYDTCITSRQNGDPQPRGPATAIGVRADTCVSRST